jgi:hypothetical protein
MGNGVRDIKEKGFILFTLDEIQSFLGKQVVGVRIWGNGDSLLVTPEIVRVVIVGMYLVQIAEPLIETLKLDWS